MVYVVMVQDVDESMGPTVFFPATNTPEWHVHYMLRGDVGHNYIGP